MKQVDPVRYRRLAVGYRSLLGLSLLLGCFAPVRARGQADEAFSVAVEAVERDGTDLLRVSFSVKDGNYLYRDHLRVELAEGSGAVLTPGPFPPSERKNDPVTGDMIDVYKHDFVLTFLVGGKPAATLPVSVGYLGCNDTTCFFPQNRDFTVALRTVSAEGATAEATDPSSRPDQQQGATDAVPAQPPAESIQTHLPWKGVADRFRMVRNIDGFQGVASFSEFLTGENVASGPSSKLGRLLEARGVALVIFVVLGGLLLNLTPCVLPMIPINVAIIGAGAQAGSKRRGFALGATYGAGIALAYGSLGLFVLVSEKRFGTLQSNPWFNLGIMILFLGMALAMLGVFNLDLSRFQKAGPSARRGGFLPALLMGAITALLAGACIAPVVIAVLLRSALLVGEGVQAGFFLPFLLGVGMALPWPFAGAGLSFLPKPGRWMERVKYGFGVLIGLFALHYGILGFSLLRPPEEQNFEAQLLAAEKSGKPVLLDFWAQWCTACAKMDKKTLKDPEIRKLLDGYSFIKFRADDLEAPAIAPVLDYYDVTGLPTFVILEPRAKE